MGDIFSEAGILNYGVSQESIFLYADNTCNFYKDKDVNKIEDARNLRMVR